MVYKYLYIFLICFVRFKYLFSMLDDGEIEGEFVGGVCVFSWGYIGCWVWIV